MTGLQPRRGPWLPQEENDLISYFNDIGADWFEISSRLMTRNAQQCRRRYRELVLANAVQLPLQVRV
ncbi:4651_t:CDS:2 [Funneliformis mosseae]|uniref:4651_t:CDS:1 n=1 Tax=Funneliformis mosseae TaxID=27381 RepID=A0A9N9BZU1_FUNMO|nr:4651_t:CDS:2 [Funneliformis mosseae]